jgi:tRNA (cmo5U34)-methyltransferase
MHHEFKRQNAYSALEISRKRTALEDVLIPESIAAHRARLESAGFRHIGVWLRQFNFVSIIATK